MMVGTLLSLLARHPKNLIGYVDEISHGCQRKWAQYRTNVLGGGRDKHEVSQSIHSARSDSRCGIRISQASGTSAAPFMGKTSRSSAILRNSMRKKVSGSCKMDGQQPVDVVGTVKSDQVMLQYGFDDGGKRSDRHVPTVRLPLRE